MPRKKRPRSSDQDGRSDGHRRLPSRVPDSPMYVQWGGRPYGRMGGGPASVPTGLESEIDFSRPAGESNVDTEVSPVSPRPGSSSPNRPARAARGRRQRRSGVQNELSTSESVSPMTPSSESAGSWSPSTGISSAGRSNPSPLREHFSPSVQEHSPLRQQDSPTRRQRRPPDQQDLVFQPQRSPSAQTQRHGGYHPYPRTARRPVIAPQPRVPPGSVSSNSAMPQAVGSHPAPVVNMPSVYGYTKSVTDDAQQWAESSLALNAYVSNTGPDSSISQLSYSPTTEERALYTLPNIPDHIPDHIQNIPTSFTNYAPHPAQSSAYYYTQNDNGTQSGRGTYYNPASVYPQQAWDASFAYASMSAVAQVPANPADCSPYQSFAGPPEPLSPHSHSGLTTDPIYQHSMAPRSYPLDVAQNFEPPQLQGPLAYSGALDVYGSPTQRPRPVVSSGHDHRPVYLTEPYTYVRPQTIHSAPPSTSDATAEVFHATECEQSSSADTRRSSV